MFLKEVKEEAGETPLVLQTNLEVASGRELQGWSGVMVYENVMTSSAWAKCERERHSCDTLWFVRDMSL